MMNPDSFNDLLKKRKTDEAALKALYDCYFPKIVNRLSRQYGKDFAVSIAREFFTKIMMIDKIKHIKHPLIWINNMCDQIIKESHDDGVNLGETEIERRMFGEFYEGMNKLAPDTKEIIVKHIYMQRSFEEIADELGMKLDIVKEKYAEGRKQLDN